MSDTSNRDSRPIILIVEDDPVGIASLAGILGDRFDLMIARTVRDARKLISSDVDLILLDLYLEDQNGLAFLRDVKGNRELPYIPVVITSGSSSESDIENAFQQGAIDYILKPFNKVILGAKVATFIDLKEKTELLSSAAYTDSLTGIANRRMFEDQLDIEWRRALRHQTKMSMLLIDLDNFKTINDTHGHQVGDHCLVSLAKIMRRTIARAGDVVARLGGDEFAAILPNTNLNEAVLVAARLQAAIANMCGGCASGKTGCPGFTTSVGCAAVVPTPSSASVELIEAADRELYQAKEEGGRNCVRPRT